MKGVQNTKETKRRFNKSPKEKKTVYIFLLHIQNISLYAYLLLFCFRYGFFLIFFHLLPKRYEFNLKKKEKDYLTSSCEMKIEKKVKFLMPVPISFLSKETKLKAKTGDNEILIVLSICKWNFVELFTFNFSVSGFYFSLTFRKR